MTCVQCIVAFPLLWGALQLTPRVIAMRALLALAWNVHASCCVPSTAEPSFFYYWNCQPSCLNLAFLHSSQYLHYTAVRLFSALRESFCTAYVHRLHTHAALLLMTVILVLTLHCKTCPNSWEAPLHPNDN